MTPFIDDIALLNRLQDIPETGAMSDLVWSDPSPSDCEGWATNSRGAGFTFSHSVAKEFLHLNDASLIARAHQLVEEGHIYNFPDKSLVTVWSAPNYCYRCGNNASIMLVREDCSTSFFDYGPS